MKRKMKNSASSSKSSHSRRLSFGPSVDSCRLHLSLNSSLCILFINIFFVVLVSVHPCLQEDPDDHFHCLTQRFCQHTDTEHRKDTAVGVRQSNSTHRQRSNERKQITTKHWQRTREQTMGKRATQHTTMNADIPYGLLQFELVR